MRQLPGLGWQVDEYDEAKRVLGHLELSVRTPQQMLSSSSAGAPRFDRTLTSWFLYQDPPDHTRLRGLVQKAFSPRVVDAWAPAIAATATELADALPQGPVDLLPSFCKPLASAGIARLLGTPPELDNMLESSSAAVLHAMGNPSPDTFAAADAALEAIDAAITEVVASGAGSGLLFELASAGEDRLRPEEFGPMASLLLAAGQETTRDLLANAFVRLIDDRTTWAQLAGDAVTDEEIAAVVDDVLRADPSVRIAARVAVVDTVVEGELVSAGEMVWIDLQATGANNPDRPVLSFGHGIHFCLGASLARREMKVGIRAVAEAHPTLTLALPPDEIPYRPNFIYRGRASVPVIVSPAT